jgi:molybdenum-dependent DNA-binding transcriptional regulator ModE
MELQQIRYFLALYEEGTFSRAANRCGVSQPSLSNAIRRLELELGGPLFVRNRKGSRLTGLGRSVLPHLLEVNRSILVAKKAAASPRRTIPSTRNAQEKSMRKMLYSAVYAVLAVFVAFLIVGTPNHPAASQFKADHISDVRAIMATIDVDALPRQDILSEADE